VAEKNATRKSEIELCCRISDADVDDDSVVRPDLIAWNSPSKAVIQIMISKLA
jgi:hypothetical protein